MDLTLMIEQHRARRERKDEAGPASRMKVCD